MGGWNYCLSSQSIIRLLVAWVRFKNVLPKELVKALNVHQIDFLFLFGEQAVLDRLLQWGGGHLTLLAGPQNCVGKLLNKTTYPTLDI